MSATIATISGDKRVQLLNSQMLRRPVILNNWTVLRIGMRVTFPSTGNIVGTPGFHLGIGSGTTAGIGDASTTNFIGLATIGATWTRNAGPPAWSTGITVKIRKKVAAVVTDSAGGTVTWTPSMDQATLGILIVEITKGSPNYSVLVAGAASQASAQTAATQAQLIQMLELAAGGMSNVSSVIAGYTVGSQSLAMSEVAGNLDCIQYYWDRSSVAAEVTEVFYRKVS